ncbi:MAG: 3-deoxy-7-phosphoheptulonate synthase, partial [Comamonadaceae bacterium]
MPDHRHEDAPLATRLDDLRIRQVRPIVSPALLQYDLPTDA